MITLIVLAYAYTIWLFTAVNPMPHLCPELVLIVCPELILEAGFCVGMYMLIKRITGNK